MDGNNRLSRINNNDNNSRLMFAVIGLLAVLVIALCLYIFVFDKNEPEPVSEEISKDSETSAIEKTSEEMSDHPTDESKAEPTSKTEESREEQSAEPVSEPVSAAEESSETETSEETSYDDSDPEHGWIINNLGYTYLYNGKGLEQFTYSTSIAEKYASSLGNAASKCGSANVYHILVPTNCEFLDIPRTIKQEDDFYCSSQKNFTEKVYSLTDGKIVNINVYDAISKRIENNDYMYYNTDPNYTHIGAYTVYAEFCKAAGIKAVSETVYSLKVLDDTFLGRFYTATGSERLKNNSDILYYYDIDDAYTASEKVYRKSGVVNRDGVIFTDVPSYSYYCYLGEEAKRIDVSTSTKSGKKILVIGDSSASPLVTLLVPHYDSITFVNSTLQTDDISDLLNGGYDDVLIINYNTNAGRLIYKNINSMAGASNE